jgi:dihydroxy-acid dehydratase
MTTGMRKRLTSYGDDGFSLFLRRAFIKAMGYSDDALDRPIVAIADTRSDYNACHGNVSQLVEAVKRGVMLAGGLPMAFPTVSIHESFAHPTSMFLRNLMAMDTEEMIRAQPMDAVVMIGGCDKTVPAQLMAAASLDIPAIQLVTGPMLVGHYRGEVLGACTDCRRFWARHRAGEFTEAEMDAINGRLAPTAGTCMVMGTASTMACLAEALGMALPGSATIPATHADRLRCAEQSGAAAVASIGQPSRIPAAILTPAAFRNAQIVLQAVGGSTNGLIHLAAIAGRRGLTLDLDEYDRLGREVPVLIDLKPTGAHYMEDFHWSGGLPRLMRELRPLLDATARTVTGATIGEAIDAAEDVPGQTVIRPRQTRSFLSAAWLCCAAISRPVAPSSSMAPPLPPSCSTPAALSFSTASKTWPRASTTPRST